LILDVLKNIIDLKLNCRYHKWAFSHDQRKALYYCTWKFILALSKLRAAIWNAYYLYITLFIVLIF